MKSLKTEDAKASLLDSPGIRLQTLTKQTYSVVLK
jgi:hypothetical protein